MPAPHQSAEPVGSIKATEVSHTGSLVVEFVGVSCSGKSYLMGRVAERLTALGYSTTTEPTPFSRSWIGRFWCRARALWWAIRLEPNWRNPQFFVLRRIIARGLLDRGAGGAPIHLVNEGIFHRVFFALRQRIGPDARLAALAEEMANGAPTRPDILVHVTARPEVVRERRSAREGSRQKTTDLARIRMELEDAVGGALPILQDFAARYGFELLTFENSAEEGGAVVEAITTSVITRFDARG